MKRYKKLFKENVIIKNVNDEFNKRFNIWYEKCLEMIKKNITIQNFDITLVVKDGQRYIGVDRQDSVEGKVVNSSRWIFIDKTNGDILKPASYKAPAKHARGNLFDEWNGLKSITEYGANYLR